MERHRRSAYILCMMSVLLMVSVVFSSANKYKLPGQQNAQQQTTPAPQVFRAQDKAVRVAHQPEIPVVILAAKNLENDWMKDWEFEVKNVSDKRIYYIGIDVGLPDIPKDEQGRVYLFYLTFGNPKLLSIHTRATSNDPYIEPGETTTLKVQEYDWKGLERYGAMKNFSSKSANRVGLRVSLLSFGDGTGFMGGAPFPVKQTSVNKLSFKNISNSVSSLTSADVGVKKNS